MQDELWNSQTTPVPEGRDKGKGKERMVDVEIEELDGPPSTKSLEFKPR